MADIDIKAIRIHAYAASINPIDWKIRAGHLKDYIPCTFPLIPGWDLSGMVDSVGPGTASLNSRH